MVLLSHTGMQIFLELAAVISPSLYSSEATPCLFIKANKLPADGTLPRQQRKEFWSISVVVVNTSAHREIHWSGMSSLLFCDQSFWIAELPGNMKKTNLKKLQYNKISQTKEYYSWCITEFHKVWLFLFKYMSCKSSRPVISVIRIMHKL